jgi:hypothetical protein
LSDIRFTDGGEVIILKGFIAQEDSCNQGAIMRWDGLEKKISCDVTSCSVVNQPTALSEPGSGGNIWTELYPGLETLARNVVYTTGVPSCTICQSEDKIKPVLTLQPSQECTP